MKKYYFLLISALFLFSCKSSLPEIIEPQENQVQTKQTEKETDKKFTKLCREVAGYSLEKQQGILSMVSIPDSKLTNATVKFLKKHYVSGIILFKKNIENEKQLKQLIKDLRQKVNPNLLIGVDQEGGDVVRIKWDKTAKVSACDIGKRADKKYAYKIAYERAKMLKELGFDITFGPVCDIAESENSYIYNRAFGTDPEKVAEFVAITVKAQRDAGIISVLKHFPGHGETDVNSHIDFPVIDMDLDKLKARDFVPFKKGLEAGAEMVLTGHIINKYIEPQVPASLSRKYQDILYKHLNFTGIIVTDDMAMTGKIDCGIGWGINLITGTFVEIDTMMKKIKPDIIQCAKVLKFIEDRKNEVNEK